MVFMEYFDTPYYYASPLGTLAIHIEDGHITQLYFSDAPASTAPVTSETLHHCITQCDEYFSGHRHMFDLPLQPRGTDFQVLVWKELLRIPHGQTTHYGEIARRLGKPLSSRAIGQACNKNPILLIIPCHRIIGKNKALTGYRGGVEKKSWLLSFEKLAS